MRRVLALAVVGWIGAAFAATKEPSPAEIDKIIESFALNESAFAKARENYTYRQTARIQEFDETGTAHGKFEEVTDITFDARGRRQERVIRAPLATLRLIQMSPEDTEDLRHVMPFVLTADNIGDYHVRYLGHQMIDEIPAYVFAVKPKNMVPGKRYFTGQIWVDDRDLMIVKTYGRSTGVLKKGNDQQFPKFETYREQIDGRYWFPTYTTANSTLYFAESRPSVKLTVRYEDYKQFKSESRILGVEEVPTPPKQQ